MTLSDLVTSARLPLHCTVHNVSFSWFRLRFFESLWLCGWSKERSGIAKLSKIKVNRLWIFPVLVTFTRLPLHCLWKFLMGWSKERRFSFSAESHIFKLIMTKDVVHFKGVSKLILFFYKTSNVHIPHSHNSPLSWKCSHLTSLSSQDNITLMAMALLIMYKRFGVSWSVLSVT